MRTIIIYRYYDQNTGKIRVSYDPLPITECQIRYYLTADENKILTNIKTQEKSYGITVPKWELNDWIEEDI